MTENAPAVSTATAPAAGGRFGGRGLNVAIVVAAAVTVAGLAALGRTAFRRHGADRHAQPRLLGALHHDVHVLRGPVGRRPHHQLGAEGLRHGGLRRHQQGGGVDEHLLHGARHRLRGGRPGDSLSGCGSCSRTPTWEARSCGTSSCWEHTSSCRWSTCGPRCVPRRGRCRRLPCAW